MYGRSIRELKCTLFKVIERTHITRKEVKKVVMDVRANMTNRPITYVKDEPRPQILTPNSIMDVKDQYLSQDIENINDNDALTKSNKKIRIKIDHIWQRWASQYL